MVGLQWCTEHGKPSQKSDGQYWTQTEQHDCYRCSWSMTTVRSLITTAAIRWWLTNLIVMLDLLVCWKLSRPATRERDAVVDRYWGVIIYTPGAVLTNPRRYNMQPNNFRRHCMSAIDLTGSDLSQAFGTLRVLAVILRTWWRINLCEDYFQKGKDKEQAPLLTINQD